jgi:cbb3-type cytochrome oxidase subunit 3
VCNENGHCHCNQGWRCPNCTEAYDGPGGSIDNGLSCQFPTTTTPPPTTTAPSTAPKEETTEIPGTETEQSFLEILMPLLIVLVGLLIFLCFTIFCYNRRNHLRQNTTEEAIIVEEDNEEADNEEADNVQANHEHAYENDHFGMNFSQYQIIMY